MDPSGLDANALNAELMKEEEVLFQRIYRLKIS